MEETVFVIDHKLTRQRLEDLVNINALIQKYIELGLPVRAVLPYGTFKGSTVSLKVGKRKLSDVCQVFRKPQQSWGNNVNTGLIWDLEAEGTNRTFHINWAKVPGGYNGKNIVTLILGGDGKTEVVKNEKNSATHLVDFMGQTVEEGDYVLMYNGPFELKNTGSPFRMLRYTGKRSEKQAQFTYVKMADATTNWANSGGEIIRVGLNTNGKEITDIIYGVKVSVDESLATAMQMTDHDMSIYPIKFHVGLTD